jgi:hypothetical protein
MSQRRKPRSTDTSDIAVLQKKIAQHQEAMLYHKEELTRHERKIAAFARSIADLLEIAGNGASVSVGTSTDSKEIAE